MPSETDALTLDEQDMLRQFCMACTSPRTVAIGLSPTIAQTPLNTQIPLRRPSARGSCTPSSIASPLAPVTSLPIERLGQRRIVKQQQSTLESGTKDSGTENTYGSAESGAELEVPIDKVLENLTRMHDRVTEPSSMTVEDIPRLIAERDAFTSQLLGVISTMARQIKELQAGGNTQATSLVRSGAKKLKVDRTPFEQQLTDLAKVRTRDYGCPSSLMEQTG